MKKITSILFALFSSIFIFGQITNGGFENWTVQPTFEHPDVSPAAFNSINNEIFYETGLLGCTEVTGTEGSAMRLETLDLGMDLAIGYGVTGDVPNGEEIIFSSGFPFSDMNVGGINLDLRYNISLFSPGFIIVQFLSGGVPVTGGPEGNGTYAFPFFGAQTSWTNQSFDFSANPLTQVPDECIVAFACNDVINETGFVGNYLEVDNFTFTGTSEVMPGGDFNTWIEVESINLPDGWDSFLPWNIDWWSQSTESYEGEFALGMETLESENGDTIQGFMYQAEVTDDGFLPNQTLEPNSQSLDFYYQFEGMPDDSASVYLIVSEVENPLPEDMAFFMNHLGPTDGWTLHSIDFSFLPNMNYYGIIFASGLGFDEEAIPGGVLLIDDVSFTTAGGCDFTPSIIEGDISLCEGDETELTTQVYDEYVWWGGVMGGDLETIGTDPTLPVFDAEEGMYEVYLSATLDGCTTISETIIVEVFGVPSPIVLAEGGGAADVCDGESIVIEVINADEYETFQWQLLGFNIPEATSDTYTAIGVLDLTSTFNVTVTTAECPDYPAVSGGIIILSHSNPSPTITQDGNTLSTGSGLDTYQWYLNGEEIEGATSETYEITEDGDYSVLVTNEWDCAGQSDDYAAVFTSVIESEFIHVSLYPNPVKDILFVELKNAPAEIFITDISGKRIQAFQLTHGGTSQLALSDLSSGVYLLTIEVSGEILHQKILVE